jgi:hypothetical protein
MADRSKIRMMSLTGSLPEILRYVSIVFLSSEGRLRTRECASRSSSEARTWLLWIQLMFYSTSPVFGEYIILPPYCVTRCSTTPNLKMFAQLFPRDSSTSFHSTTSTNRSTIGDIYDCDNKIKPNNSIIRRPETDVTSAVVNQKHIAYVYITLEFVTNVG